MNVNLKPIESRNQKLKINGQSERILETPKTRDEEVLMTMGGREEHAIRLSVNDFEANTGYYFVGLEPKYDYELDKEVEKFKAMLVREDFNLEDPTLHTRAGSDVPVKLFMAGGNIKFATKTNVMPDVQSRLRESGENYIVRISRESKFGAKKSKEFSGPKSSLPLLLSNAERTVKAYTSTKVQILSKIITEEESKRKHDKDGYPILKLNEGVDDYFNNQEMNAGIVINNHGDYQAFTSHPNESDSENIQKNKVDFKHGEHNFRTSNDTNSYKNIKLAVKFLNDNGYDSQGRALDNVNEEEFAEGFRTYGFQSSLFDSFGQDEVAHIKKENGSIKIHHLQKENDDKFGTRYTVLFDYTEEETGRKHLKTCHVPAENYLGRAIPPMFAFLSEVNDLYAQDSGVDFEPDNRSDKEKITYHTERFLHHKSKLSTQSRLMSERDEKPGDDTNRDKLISRIESKMAHHQESYMELKSPSKESSSHIENSPGM
jgi:hypothetical protein